MPPMPPMASKISKASSMIRRISTGAYQLEFDYAIPSAFEMPEMDF